MENQELKQKLAKYEQQQEITEEIKQIDDLVNSKYIKKVMSKRTNDRLQKGLELCECIESFFEGDAIGPFFLG